MPKAPLLSAEEIDRELAAVPGWERSGDAIVKAFRFRNFAEALAFVNRASEPAEAMDHHPDVAIHWDTVTLTLWTHASGGLTAKDFALASAIDAVT